MLVSVVIPTFNRANFIGDAVASALREADEGMEVIVVDDGSTDATSQVLAGFGTAITVVRQANGGVSRARNAGIEQARGSFIKFVDSDDIVPDGALPKMLAHARAAGPREIVLGDAECLYEDGSIAPGASHGYGYGRFGGSGPLDLAEFLSWGMQTELPLFPRQALLDVGGFDESLYLAEEKELTLRLWHAGWRFSCVPLVVAQIRVHGAARLSTSKGPAALDTLIHCLDKMVALLDDMPGVSHGARVALARIMWSEARDATRSGVTDRAETLFAKATRLGGRDAVVGDWIMHRLYALTTPVRAERLATAAKRVAGR